jgi:hypothetical protein
MKRWLLQSTKLRSGDVPLVTLSGSNRRSLDWQCSRLTAHKDDHAFETCRNLETMRLDPFSGASGQSVAEILKTERSSIKNADLPAGSPTWRQIMNMTWEQIEAAARANKPGSRTIKKLLTGGGFNK